MTGKLVLFSVICPLIFTLDTVSDIFSVVPLASVQFCPILFLDQKKLLKTFLKMIMIMIMIELLGKSRNYTVYFKHQFTSSYISVYKFVDYCNLETAENLEHFQ